MIFSLFVLFSFDDIIIIIFKLDFLFFLWEQIFRLVKLFDEILCLVMLRQVYMNVWLCYVYYMIVESSLLIIDIYLHWI